MKKVFGAIGGFFKRIWRWIAETAWIQPLLIVGLIFGVIFSIPSISSWISNASESYGRYAYYNANVLKSKDLLEFEDSKGYETLYEKDGKERFLIVFIEEDCNYCVQDEEAFKLFSKKQNWDYDGNQAAAPSVRFVYCNYDEDDDSSEAESWRQYVEVANLYDTVEEYYKETCEAYGITQEDSYLAPMESETPKLPTPLIAYYENGAMEEVIMGLEGSTNIERMQYLRDFYFHINDFDL